jgi:membrane-associated phospholipid phosphatase
MTQAQSEARETAQAHWPKPGHLAAVGVGGVVGSLLIGVAVHSGPTAFDTWLHHLVVVHRGDHHTLARTLTQAGSTRIIWPVVAVASLLFPRSRGWRRVATTLAFGGAAALAIGVRLWMSEVLNRPRPPVVDWATTAGGFAYPSGHTSAAQARWAGRWCGTSTAARAGSPSGPRSRCTPAPSAGLGSG